MRKDISIIFAALLVILVALAVISAGCTDNSGTATATPTPEATVAETAAPTEETVSPTSVPPEAPKTSVSGEGNENVTVSLTKGVYVMTVTQDTPVESTIGIEPGRDYIGSKNAYNTTVAEQSMKDGKYYWARAFMVRKDSDVTAQVETTGKWTLDFSFPQQINGIVPQTFSGTASKATPFFQINEGIYNFSITAENNDVISVTLMDYEGNDVEVGYCEMPLPYYEGPYDDVVTVALNESNNYLFNVECDGDWTVSVTEA